MTQLNWFHISPEVAFIRTSISSLSLWEAARSLWERRMLSSVNRDQDSGSESLGGGGERRASAVLLTGCWFKQTRGAVSGGGGVRIRSHKPPLTRGPASRCLGRSRCRLTCSSGGDTCRLSCGPPPCRSGPSPARVGHLGWTCAAALATQTARALNPQNSNPAPPFLVLPHSRQLGGGSVQVPPHPVLTRLDDLHLLVGARGGREASG